MGFSGLISVTLLAASTLLMPSASTERSQAPDENRESSVCLGPAYAGYVPSRITADRVETDGAKRNFTVKISREYRGEKVGVPGVPLILSKPGSLEKITALTDDDGLARIQISCLPGLRMQLESSLQTNRYRVTNGFQSYRLVADFPCGGATEVIFNEGSPGANALGMWDVAVRAEKKLQATVGLDFWVSPVHFVWPSDTNHFSMGTVHIVNGGHWDIVSHEFGHAIYDQAKLGKLGTGSHHIDGCYTADLALAEGWASFFAAWLNLDPNDPDPKFEFMAPRLAPIQIEHIPQQVCLGETNEWRVAGFFWDLLDRNDDGEDAETSFEMLWNTMSNSRAPSTSKVRELLQTSGMKPGTLDRVWELNFER
ncbi:MAG: hypothetical protein NDJ90_02680 [Oligoflexia bacterium]|nr:hypothetical protein [Oligoflexia bacterium]